MLLCNDCKHYINCVRLVFLYIGFKQLTSQFNLLSIKIHSCYKLSSAPPLMVSVAATFCWELGKLFNFLMTSVPSLYAGEESTLSPLSATHLLCFLHITGKTNCWKPRSSPTKSVTLFFLCYHLCFLSFLFGPLSAMRYSIKWSDTTQLLSSFYNPKSLPTAMPFGLDSWFKSFWGKKCEENNRSLLLVLPITTIT